MRLLELHAKTSVSLDEITDTMRPRYRHWANVPAGAKDGVFKVRANLELVLSAEKEVSKKTADLLVKVQYELEYHLPSDFRVTRPELNAFAKVNGVYNAWPYFRELVQSMTLRMDLPPIVLPVFRVPQATAAKKSDS